MFDIEVIYLYVLFFKVLINFPGTAGVLSSALDTFLYHFLLIMISMVCEKICCLYQPIFSFACIKIHSKVFEKHQ